MSKKKKNVEVKELTPEELEMLLESDATGFDPEEDLELEEDYGLDPFDVDGEDF